MAIENEGEGELTFYGASLRKGMQMCWFLLIQCQFQGIVQFIVCFFEFDIIIFFS